MSALRRRLNRDGVILLEDALEPDHVARLTSAVDRIWRERGSGSALHLLGFVGLDESFVVPHASGGAFVPALAASILLGIGTALVYPTLIAAVSDAVQPDRASLGRGCVPLLA